MSDQQGFFGDIFDSPDDDPLLQSDDESEASGPGSGDPSGAAQPAGSSASGSTSEEVPSWMNDESFMSEGAAEDDLDEEVPAEQQEVVVAPRDGDEMRGVETLNEAFDHGWRLRRIGRATDADLPDPSFVVTIERDIPRSLFDFGGAGH